MHSTALERLSDAVCAMDVRATEEAARRSLESGVEPYDAIEIGLGTGMQRANDLFERHEYFIPELLLCSDAMYAGLAVLKPHLTESASSASRTVVIGVVEGDTHDIGKNIVSTMLQAAGFAIIDLGRNVSLEQFERAVDEHAPDVVALSTLMTSTMHQMEAVVSAVRGRCGTIVGGAPVSAGFARRIGADCYAPNAAGAVRELRELAKVGV